MLPDILMKNGDAARSGDPSLCSAVPATHATETGHPPLAPAWRGLAEQVGAQVDTSRLCLVVPVWRARSWLDRLCLGYLRWTWTVCALARRSGLPVLVARDAHSRSYARVLMQVDLSPAGAAGRNGRARGGAADTFAAALRCAPGARFTLLHSLDTGVEGYMHRAAVAGPIIERYRRKLRIAASHAFGCLLGWHRLPAERFTLAMTPHPERAGLRVHAGSLDPDLVVAGVPRRGFVGAWLGLGAIREVLAATTCDLLVVAGGDDRAGSEGPASGREPGLGRKTQCTAM